MLKDLTAAEVAAIRIEAPDGTLYDSAQRRALAIAERKDFPADLDKVRAFMLKAIELKVGQSEPIGEADRARIALERIG